MHDKKKIEGNKKFEEGRFRQKKNLFKNNTKKKKKQTRTITSVEEGRKGTETNKCEQNEKDQRVKKRALKRYTKIRK